jgi:DSF synthase
LQCLADGKPHYFIDPMKELLPRTVIAPSVVFETESLTATYDPATRTIWHRMHVQPRPCFSEAFLRDALELHGLIRRGVWAVDFYVLRSEMPRVFNLGGDLNMLRGYAMKQDWAGVSRYARLCVDTLYGMVSGFDQQVISIAEISGDALGGGFEAALACDFMIAEKGVKLGFPEVLFNLFPGMGAFSLLARKLGPQVAQRMILSGAMYQPEMLQAQGLLDEVAETGCGRNTVQSFIRTSQKQLRGIKGLMEARRRTALWPTHQELVQVVEHWADCVKQVSERDLRLIERLVSAQNRVHPTATNSGGLGGVPDKPQITVFPPKETLPQSKPIQVTA